MTRATGHLPTCSFSGCACDATAYHEAGHAVAAHSLGVRVRLVDARSLRGDTVAYVRREVCRIHQALLVLLHHRQCRRRTITAKR